MNIIFTFPFGIFYYLLFTFLKKIKIKILYVTTPPIVLYSENNLLNTGVKMGVRSQQKKKERKKGRKKERKKE
jgi:hypothetical protein